MKLAYLRCSSRLNLSVLVVNTKTGIIKIVSYIYMPKIYFFQVPKKEGC